MRIRFSHGAALLAALKTSGVRVIGGSVAVSGVIFNAIKAAVPATVRVSGADRYASAVAVSANAFSAVTSQVFVTTGLNFPDGMVVAPLAGKTKSPLFLSNGTCVDSGVIAQMSRLGATKLVLLGGTNALGAPVAAVSVCF